MVIGDVTTDPHYIEVVPGMVSTLAVPLVQKGSRSAPLTSWLRARPLHQETAILQQFAALVAAALVNARLFEQQRPTPRRSRCWRRSPRSGRRLDLNELLARIVQLMRRVSTTGRSASALERSDARARDEIAVQYGERVPIPRVPLGEGFVGTPRSMRGGASDVSMTRATLASSTTCDPSGRAVLHKDLHRRIRPREPELDAFTKRHVEILTLLASQAAVAMKCGCMRSWPPKRLEQELGLPSAAGGTLPTALPKKLKAWMRLCRSRRRTSSAAIFTIFWCPTRTRSSSRSATSGGACGALRGVCRRAGARPDAPPSLRA
jgi:hypothetical protein